MDNQNANFEPNVFISYCHANEDHKKQVKRIVDKLKEKGIKTIFDQEDLKLGQDVNYFMEKVKSEETTHVLVFSDKEYADRANNRSGGVGTESQLLSEDVYKDVKQEKVIGIVLEKDNKGSPYLPKYLEPRRYVDFTKNEDEELQKLVEHLLNQNNVNSSTRIDPADSNQSDKTQYRHSNISYNNYDSILQKLKQPPEIKHTQDAQMAAKRVLGKLKEIRPLRAQLLRLIKYDLNLCLTAPNQSSQFEYSMSKVIEDLYRPNKKAGLDECFALVLKEVILYSVLFMINNDQFDTIYKLIDKTYFPKTVPKDDVSFGCLYDPTLLKRIKNQLNDERPESEKERVVKYPVAYLIKVGVFEDLAKLEDLVDVDITLAIVTRFLGLSKQAYWPWITDLSFYKTRGEHKVNPLHKMVSKQEALKIIKMFGIDDLEEFKTNFKKAFESLPADEFRPHITEIKIDDCNSLKILKIVDVNQIGSRS